MSDMANKQLLHRYTVKVVKDEVPDNMTEKVPNLEIIASFYRNHVDPGYQFMMKELFDAGIFDEFVAAVLQGLLHQGTSFPPFS